ncbi:MAG: glycosyltransferase family 4 protein, partial [Armatimonadota bacterium]|nr:glycosyltransferase family 4 protein [Armatimonadota bacterium]
SNGPRLVRVATDAYHFWNFMDGQGRFLRSQGWDVHAVAPPGQFLEKFAEREQVPVHEVEMSRSMSLDLQALRALRRIFRQLRPDIVHSSTPKAGYLAMLASWSTGVPIRIYHANGLRWWTLNGVKRFMVMQGQKVACRLAHSVLCVSPSIRQAMIDNGVCSAERARVLASGHGNGVDADHRFNPDRLEPGLRERVRQELGLPRDAVVAGFLGRIVGDKGIEEIIQAWLLLRDEVPHLYLLLVGDFDETDPVSSETQQVVEDDPRIKRTGWVDEVVPLYAAMDFCLVPSYREGFPTIALEAGAMGLPLVTTDALGCIDAVEDGVTGVQVPVGAVEPLRDAMVQYVDDPQLRLKHGRAARLRVCRQFRNDIVWKALHEEYLRLVREKGLSPPQPISDTTAQPAEALPHLPVDRERL